MLPIPQAKLHFRPASLTEAPDEVAVRLRHLPGFAWLDTAGNSHLDDEGISILAAQPREILRGHLSQPEPLRRALRQLEPVDSRDWGLPNAGLIGEVDFSGTFTFGLYDQWLVHRHATGEWWQTGNLLDLARSPSPLDPPPAVDFLPLIQAESYCAMVRRAQEFIAAGDIYQVNLSHPVRSSWPTGADALSLYLRLREISPAPYSAFLDLGRRQVLSSSPESFLKMSGHGIRTRPIKGTRPRFRDQAADQKSAFDLLSSEKERAELLMITDLERNDLGRVSQFGSVSVSELLKLEAYAQVYHLVSTVQGVLRTDSDHLSALQSCFPGGSISGAPKKRALEIIHELEFHPRGLYTGAIGFLGANGESHFNIAIRTLTITDAVAEFHVGAGIVADSDPICEWEETLHKAGGLLALADFC